VAHEETGLPINKLKLLVGPIKTNKRWCVSNLTNQTCEACEIGAPLVPEVDQAKLLEGLGWMGNR
jgi:hypothetical protein